MSSLRLGVQFGYWQAKPHENFVEAAQEAEKLGYDSVFTAEAWGSDAFTPLAWIGAHTSRIRLGTSIVQISARTPTSTAMHALTLDHLSGGRLTLGLGVSGPQVVEGWYGQPYTKPLERTREYISIMRKIFAREERVTFEGNQYQLPKQGGAGLGKALRSTLHPFRPDIPIYLAAEGPKNVALAAEIADGWLPLFFSPKMDKFYTDALGAGFAKDGSRKEGFEVASMVPVIVSEDIEAAANFVRPMLSLYMGGMGAKGANFHYDVFVRLGYEGVAENVQKLYLEGKKNEATASIPLELVEDVALIGPPGKIKDELPKWKDTCLTTMLLSGPPQMLETVANLVNG